jgi:glucose-6-phosphate isomerase
MALPSINPTKTETWCNLKTHYEFIKNKSLQSFFAENPNRANEFHIQWEDFLLDYSKNLISKETIKLLIELANESGLKKAIQQQFEGENINQTEDRAVLHTALRASENQKILVGNENIIPEIAVVKNRIKTFSESVISGEKKGFTNLPFTDVVNIGIGGSDLGPAMAAEALQFYKNHLNVHFVSNIDGDHVAEILKKLNPETTLFVVVSKTFTTQETLSNAETIKKWFLQFGNQEDIAQHFVAVSTNIERVTQFGISKANIFPMWDWVGGRFSLWSAVGLSLVLSIGYSNFEQVLIGAQKMDNHFQNADFEENLPVILALLSIWYNNFFDAETEAIIPYTQYLQKFVPYLQQAIMESNGKNTDRNGQIVSYQTGTVVWGEPGTNSQHAFFQLLHQGTKLIPADFIGFKKSLHGNDDHHQKLMANFFAQTEALLMGKSTVKVEDEFKSMGLSKAKAETLLPFKVFSGNRPTNTLLINQLTPASFGSLVALYEHKIFVQGIIWNIYSYDQWGVELGKQLATTILDEIQSNTLNAHDSSTSFLIQQFLDTNTR